jgi:hypothetical protein
MKILPAGRIFFASNASRAVIKIMRENHRAEINQLCKETFSLAKAQGIA